MMNSLLSEQSWRLCIECAKRFILLLLFKNNCVLLKTLVPPVFQSHQSETLCSSLFQEIKIIRYFKMKKWICLKSLPNADSERLGKVLITKKIFCWNQKPVTFVAVTKPL